MFQKTDCPKDDSFYDYMTGSLSPRRQKSMTKHMKKCKSCHQSFKMAKEFLQDIDSKDYQKASEEEAELFIKKMSKRAEKNKNKSLLKKMKHSLLQLGEKIQTVFEDSVPWITTSQANLSYAHVRSVNDSQNVRYILHKKDIDNIQSKIYIQQLTTDCFCLDFKVLNEDIENDIIRVSLKNIENNDEYSKPLLDNRISFENLCYGNYELMIKQNNAYKDLFNFEINQEGLHER
ncbi:hypothetical protein MHK_003226 [Candidatus Magnetomorum sp. HK-1]|nr:hypothetical protein MHK_003226 [Candidatus Magnetomorum sp. HK-1]